MPTPFLRRKLADRKALRAGGADYPILNVSDADRGLADGDPGYPGCARPGREKFGGCFMKLIFVSAPAPCAAGSISAAPVPRPQPGAAEQRPCRRTRSSSTAKAPALHPVQAGDGSAFFAGRSTCRIPLADGPAFCSSNIRPGVIYEDSFLLLADKPAGLPVSGEQADTLLNRVLLYLFNAENIAPGQGFAPAALPPAGHRHQQALWCWQKRRPPRPCSPASYGTEN